MVSPSSARVDAHQKVVERTDHQTWPLRPQKADEPVLLLQRKLYHRQAREGALRHAVLPGEGVVLGEEADRLIRDAQDLVKRIKTGNKQISSAIFTNVHADIHKKLYS